jgi:hypothetical protein
MAAYKPNPFGVRIKMHWLQVVDVVGGRTVKARITPFIEHLHWRWVRIANFNARGRPEIYYEGFTGGAGAVPTYAGIRGWNGSGKHRFWSYAPPYPVLLHNGHRFYYAGGYSLLENLAAAATSGLEVHLVQGERRATEPERCPSWELIRNYRFNPTKAAWVLYHVAWKRT